MLISFFILQQKSIPPLQQNLKLIDQWSIILIIPSKRVCLILLTSGSYVLLVVSTFFSIPMQFAMFFKHFFNISN